MPALVSSWRSGAPSAALATGCKLQEPSASLQAAVHAAELRHQPQRRRPVGLRSHDRRAHGHQAAAAGEERDPLTGAGPL